MNIIHKLSNNQKKDYNEQRLNVARQRAFELVIRKQQKQILLYTLVGDDQKEAQYKAYLRINRQKLAALIARYNYLSYDYNRLRIAQTQTDSIKK
ncbi:hypothetical protein [Oenococcus phage Vinitor-27]|nr:hypothetical protein [Oenococcus phage Vinitor-27]